MNTTLYILSIIIFFLAFHDLIVVLNDFKKALTTFSELKEKKQKKNINININPIVFYNIFKDILLITFLILNWKNVHTLKDLSGIDRVVCAGSF